MLSKRHTAGFMLARAACMDCSDAAWVIKTRGTRPSYTEPFCIMEAMETFSLAKQPATADSTPGASVADMRM